MNSRILSLAATTVMASTLVLAGCNKADQADAKSTAGDAAARVENTAKEVGADAAAGMEKAKDATKSAAAAVGEKVDDAMITASVKTELAKDSNLSALKINVDTSNGRVALKGSAPSAEAKAQATVLAKNVKGVSDVDNQLTVEAAKM